MKPNLKTSVLTVLSVALLLGTAALSQEKIKVEKLDDLPRHVYKIEVPAVDLLDNREALMKLAHEVKADLQSDLETYDIPDKSTLQNYYSTLFAIAVLDEEYDAAGNYIEMARELEDKQGLKLTIGLIGRAYIAAAGSGEDSL
ncbi:MAG: hypothetical protein PVH11_04390, partial [Anaerolineae bacterium]